MGEALAATGMVRRYAKSYDEPDDFTCDVVWTDRLTGRCVLRYDGADPANTSPAYGAPSDADVFARKGLDILEEVEIGRCVVPVPPAEVERWARQKAATAEREAEEEAAEDLFDVLGAAADAFDWNRWRDGEERVLRPALEARGYTGVNFYMLEEDSFGPMIRGCVAHDADGKRVRFFYG